MSLACPECGAAAPRGAVAGRAYACPGCGNPVLPAERGPRPTPSAGAAPRSAGASGARASDAPASDGPASAGAAPRSGARRTLGLAAAAFLVLGAAYVGVYELLTAEAKRERAEIVRVHGADVLEAPSPGPRPETSDAVALRAWNAARDRHELRTRHEALTQRADWFFRGMLAAFAAQAVLTAALAVRTLRAPAAARGVRSPRTPSTRA